MTRRAFLKVAAMGAGSAAAGGCVTSGGGALPCARRITVADTGCEFEREPLLRPFGFKGGYLTNIWQSAAMIRSTGGQRGIGICTHSALWENTFLPEGVMDEHTAVKKGFLDWYFKTNLLMRIMGGLIAGAVVGISKVRKIIFNAVLFFSRRDNLKTFDTLEAAKEWLCTYKR